MCIRDRINPIQEDLLMRGKAVKEFSNMITINEARGMVGLPAVDKIGQFSGDDMYIGFVQASINDNEEISDVNGTTEDQEEEQNPENDE